MIFADRRCSSISPAHSEPAPILRSCHPAMWPSRWRSVRWARRQSHNSSSLCEYEMKTSTLITEAASKAGENIGHRDGSAENFGFDSVALPECRDAGLVRDLHHLLLDAYYPELARTGRHGCNALAVDLTLPVGRREYLDDERRR